MASAILWVSSRFFTAVPRLFDASSSSPASFSDMVFSPRLRAAVTSQRIIVKRGLVSLHTVEMNVDKVESVDVDQSILGRMMGFGTVTIHRIGARWDPIPLISGPLGFRNAITVR